MSIYTLEKTVLTSAIIVFALLAMNEARSQDVKYCKDYRTGEIIVIEAGFPCPSPTVEL